MNKMMIAAVIAAGVLQAAVAAIPLDDRADAYADAFELK